MALHAVLGVGVRVLVVFAAFGAVARETYVAGALALVSSAVYLAQRALAAATRVRVECELHAKAAEALLRGDVLDLPPSDLEWTLFDANFAARSAFAATVPSFLADVLVSLGLLPVIASLLPLRVAAWAGLAVAVAVALGLGLRKVSLRAESSILEAQRGAMQVLFHALEGRLEVVAQGREGDFSERLGRALSTYAERATKLRLASALSSRAAFALGGAILLVGYFSDDALREAITVGVVPHALVLAACAPSFVGVVRSGAELLRARIHLERLWSILERAPRGERGGQATVKLPAQISAEELSFGYDTSNSSILNAFSFEWDPKRPLVLTGPNGSGKSTLLRLLLGLRPPRTGALRVGPRLLGELDLVAWRKRIAFLPQRPYLGQPTNSVREAMHLLAPQASDDAIASALERTQVLGALLTRATEPLDVAIGELSAGQRQRVALARILLQEAEVVFLDEPDANLDAEGHVLVGGLIGELASRDVMVVLAAHSPALLAAVDAVRVDLGQA